MIKNAIVSVRLDPELKNNVENVFNQLGLTVSQAITLFYKQVELHRGLPFSIKLPNKETELALEDARLRKNLTSFETTESLFEELEI